jgi:hypothetical protein
MEDGRNKANPAGQQFLHHALLEEFGFVSAGLQGGDLGIHVGENGGYGLLF